VQRWEKVGDDLLLTVKPPAPIDKGTAERQFDEIIEARLEAAKQTALLEAERQHRQDLKAITLATVTNLGNALSHLTIHNQLTGGNNMPETHDSSQNVTINTGGGNLTASGQALNLGTLDISGTVSETINQLPNAPSTPEQPSLKDLLTQLHSAITTAELSDADKTDLLEQVQALATANQTDEPAQKEGIARKATKMFKATLDSLPDTAKLAEACSKLLPLILKALGL
jgi:hypothetical protein